MDVSNSGKILQGTRNIAAGSITKSEVVMKSSRYIMQDQARDTVDQIMLGPIRDKLLLKPAWLGLLLLVAAINLLTLIPHQ